jgi:hypothetical protein
LKSLKRIIIKLFVILILSTPCIAQVQNDTTGTVESSEDTLFQMQKSPWGAVLRSAIIPGWGQLYNESYWKIPVVAGIFSWLIYNYVDNHNNYWDYKKLYLQTGLSNNKINREFYRDQRDLFAIYIGLAYLATLVDAYVDAHLFDFSVTEDNGLNLNFKYHF